jgi:hypothetical protein
MTLYEFFDEVSDGDLSQLDIYNYLEGFTKGFESGKIELTLRDLEYYIFCEKEELQNNYDLNDLVGDGKKFKSFEDIPYKDIKNVRDGLESNTSETHKYYDYEALFYPYHFYGLRQIKKLLVSKLKTSKEGKETQTPFTDPKTHELFNYIVDNWSYERGQKWADIWNVINDLDNHKPPFKNEYQNYIIKRFGYTGKFQYDKPKKDGNRDKQSLLELIENFSKK